MKVSNPVVTERTLRSLPVLVVFEGENGDYGYQLRSSLNIPLLAGIFASPEDRDAAVRALGSVEESAVAVTECENAWAVVVRQGGREIGRSPLMTDRAFAFATSKLTVLQAKKARRLS